MAGKKKWSKGRVKDKANNAVVFDKPTYDRLFKEVPTYKLVTPSILVDRLRLNGSVARAAIKELEKQGIIKAVTLHGAQKIYTRATKNLKSVNIPRVNNADVEAKLQENQDPSEVKPKRKYNKGMRAERIRDGDPIRKYTKKAKNESPAPSWPVFDPEVVAEFSKLNPDPVQPTPTHTHANTGIAFINEANPLVHVDDANIRDRGTAFIWDMNTFEKLQCLKDEKETNIDEFYTGCWTFDSKHMIIGGKLKDRQRWSEPDDDNHILPCPLKVFDVVEGNVIQTFHGHFEEVLSTKLIEFRGNQEPPEKKQITDGYTCMAFTTSFLPNTGNKYFIASCDDSIRLYDFEESRLLQTFPNIFSCYCDFSTFLNCLDYEACPTWDQFSEDNPMFSFLICRGVEVLDGEDETISNMLIYPTKKGDKFQLEQVRKFQHSEYRSNSWLVKLATNGRYVAAPTYDGNIFLFHLLTGQVVGILRDHQAYFKLSKKILGNLKMVEMQLRNRSVTVNSPQAIAVYRINHANITISTSRKIKTRYMTSREPELPAPQAQPNTVDFITLQHEFNMTGAGSTFHPSTHRLRQAAAQALARSHHNRSGRIQIQQISPRRASASNGTVNPSIHPQFRSKTVCNLYCSHCESRLCERGMRAILLGHFWMFLSDAVWSKDRLEKSGNTILKWSSLAGVDDPLDHGSHTEKEYNALCR
ncbi:hypothetical protein HDV04_002403 [Boothiomyces sp. JEL0838]|nr:hypothetical protein HDV04_002403 [Boothiomyces sp. JEL0838]